MRSMTVASLSTLILSFLATPVLSRAEQPAVRVIVHESNQVDSLSRSQVSDYLLKKAQRWDDGREVSPVDQPDRSKIRETFNMEIHCRAGRAVTNYWQNRIFAGSLVPPPTLPSDEDVVAFVREHPGAIGYVSGDARLDGVRPVSVTDD